jgi:hypothetical protein
MPWLAYALLLPCFLHSMKTTFSNDWGFEETAACILTMSDCGQVRGWQGAARAAARPAHKPQRRHRDAAQVRAAAASRIVLMSRAQSDGDIAATQKRVYRMQSVNLACCRALKGSRYKGGGKLPEKPLVYYGWDISNC